MFIYAVIKDNIVVNSILAENKKNAEDATGNLCIMSNAKIDSIYNPETGIFTEVVLEDTAPAEDKPLPDWVIAGLSGPPEETPAAE